MMQLVNDSVVILNPTKDNLILDSAGVEATLGVPPARVIDVMALRGDAIDNIPGAPGIGDKGSVELIQQFGTVEAALDAAQNQPDQVKRKTYRESLQNNRENIMLSKELVTIHTFVPIESRIEQMATQAPDNAACRDLFSELEFTTLLKELAPAVGQHADRLQSKHHHSEQIAALLADARGSEGGEVKGLTLAVFEDARALAAEIAPERERSRDRARAAAGRDDEPLRCAPGGGICEDRRGLRSRARVLRAVDRSFDLRWQRAGRRLLDAAGLREALEDATLPKHVHDLKAVLRLLEPQGIKLAGVRDDVMLYSYLINPTHGSHTLADVTARFTHRALQAGSPSSPRRPKRCRQPPRGVSADRRCDPTPLAFVACSARWRALGCKHIYETMDLPLVSVLLRMEQAGVRIDSELLRTMSSRLAIEMDALAERIYTESGHRFNINSPKQLGDVLFNKMLCRSR